MNQYLKGTIGVIVTLCCLLFTSVSAQTETTDPQQYTTDQKSGENVIDDIREAGADGPIGPAYIPYATTTGSFEICSTDAFFYLLLVNESSEDATVTLPRRAKIHGRYYYVDESFLCKDVPVALWQPENYADANAGTSCETENNVLLLPKRSAVSIRGKIVNFPHALSRENDAEELTGEMPVSIDIQINNKRKTVTGNLFEEGDICGALEFPELANNNRVEGGYFIDPSGEDVCSMNYFFIVENTDLLYTNVVELPSWIQLNNSRWDIGCSYLYEDCEISGFRHYAWAVISDNSKFRTLNYRFCDQDRAAGDNCYEENGLWWLRIPPQTKIAVRGMVNDLCDAESALLYPLSEDTVYAGLEIHDAGSNIWWVDGLIAGTELPASVTNSSEL